MSVLDPKKTYKNLKKKGFVDSINKSSDHKWVDFFINSLYMSGMFIIFAMHAKSNFYVDKFHTEQGRQYGASPFTQTMLDIDLACSDLPLFIHQN